MSVIINAKLAGGAVTAFGTTDGGVTTEQKVSAEGHSEVAIHDPILPFGSVHVENMHPEFQFDGIYGLNTSLLVVTEATGGTATADKATSLIKCQTGTSVGGYSALQTRKRLRYRPGQGVVGRFTAMFTSPVALSNQVIGFGHPEDGYFIGYQNTTFGIYKSVFGVREVQTLTITTASTHSENITVTLAGTNFSVAVTNSGVIATTAKEIASGTYTGWAAEQIGNTVVFLANAVGDKTGTFEVTATSTVATFSETRAGAAVSTSFIAQSDFNGDTLDGSGPSGFTLDPTKLNLYQIDIAWLGAGCVTFKTMVTSDDNNATWVTFHTIKNPNSDTKPHSGNPSFPFTMSAYSQGSTTNLTVSTASVAGFIEGNKILHGPRMSYFAQSTGINATDYKPLFTLRNNRTHGGRANQSVINLRSVAGAIKHTSPVVFYLIKNGTLAGTPNWSLYASGVSCSSQDTSATAVTISTNDQILWSGHLGDTGEINLSIDSTGKEELTLQPGEYVSLCAKSSFGSPSYVTGSLNTREDQ